MEKKYNLRICLPLLVFIVYLLLDYLNIPSNIGVNIWNINTAFFDVISNIVLVVVLYVISYYYIENRQREKDRNAIDTAKVLMLNIYRDCKGNFGILNDKSVLVNYVVPKVDFDKVNSENGVVCNLQNTPFENNAEIMHLAEEGYITKVDLEEYLHIKQEYQYIVFMMITLYDSEQATSVDAVAFIKSTEERKQALITGIDSAIRRMEEG